MFYKCIYSKDVSYDMTQLWNKNFEGLSESIEYAADIRGQYNVVYTSISVVQGLVDSSFSSSKNSPIRFSHFIYISE